MEILIGLCCLASLAWLVSPVAGLILAPSGREAAGAALGLFLGPVGAVLALTLRRPGRTREGIEREERYRASVRRKIEAEQAAREGRPPRP